MPVDFTIPAEGELGVQMFYSKVPWSEDRFAETLEIRPGNRSVVHHAGVFVVDIPEAPASTNTDGWSAQTGSQQPTVVTAWPDVPIPPRCLERTSCCRGFRSRRRLASRRHRQADSRRQIHQLANALQPER
jgi:hypothetical protein